MTSRQFSRMLLGRGHLRMLAEEFQGTPGHAREEMPGPGPPCARLQAITRKEGLFSSYVDVKTEAWQREATHPRS
jgi:hypothetical protein